MKALRIFKIKPLLLGLTVSFFVLGFTKCNSKNIEERNLESKVIDESSTSDEKKDLRYYKFYGIYSVWYEDGRIKESAFKRRGSLSYSFCEQKPSSYRDSNDFMLHPNLRVRLYSKSGEMLYEDYLKGNIFNIRKDEFINYTNLESINSHRHAPFHATLKLPENAGEEDYVYRIVRLEESGREILIEKERHLLAEWYNNRNSIYKSKDYNGHRKGCFSQKPLLRDRGHFIE